VVVVVVVAVRGFSPQLTATFRILSSRIDWHSAIQEWACAGSHESKS
jgi:hypothetical protein